ncbi:MAG: Gfo/Idh/MocA family oxidoreductase [Candidatus Hydrogenedentes bacterium]|nr:Gfo/Idh/MocA family oxidoreductase [Candidatus Hydrogenedentota bacterium]
MLKPVRLGLVGLNFGATVCRELTGNPALPVRLTTVCDMDAARAQERAAEFGVPYTTSLDQLLDDPAIDAIGLYTGPNGRANLIRRIIRAGKHVMTTKPFERDADEALRVLHEARDLGKVVHLNSPNPRPIAEMVYIKEWISSGAIGRPTVAQASTWVYYGATPPDGSWYDDPQLCPVAPIFRIGIYCVNSFLSIFGEPATVQVTHSRVETKRPTPDNASLTIAFKSGAIANILASFVAASTHDRYRGGTVIGGTKGMIFHGIGPAAREGEAGPNLILSSEDRIESHVITGHSGEYDWEFFAQRVRGEVDHDVTTPEEVAAAIRVVAAMSEAERTGKTVACE